MQKSTAVLALAALCGACAAPYAPPTGTNIATLTIFNETDTHLRIDTFGDQEKCSQRQEILPEPGIAPRKSHTVSVAAGQPFTLNVRTVNLHSQITQNMSVYSAGTRYCQIMGTFRPSPGQSYSGYYRLAGSGCQFILLRGDTKQGRPEASFRSRSEEDACKLI